MADSDRNIRERADGSGGVRPLASDARMAAWLSTRRMACAIEARWQAKDDKDKNINNKT